MAYGCFVPVVFVPVVGDSYRIVNNKWFHQPGQIVTIIKIEDERLYWAPPGTTNGKWLRRDLLTPENVKYIGKLDALNEPTHEELEEMKNGLAEMLASSPYGVIG